MAVSSGMSWGLSCCFVGCDLVVVLAFRGARGAPAGAGWATGTTTGSGGGAGSAGGAGWRGWRGSGTTRREGRVRNVSASATVGDRSGRGQARDLGDPRGDMAELALGGGRPLARVRRGQKGAARFAPGPLAPLGDGGADPDADLGRDR